MRLHGEEDERTLLASLNYASSLYELRRFKEAKSLLRKIMPVSRRVLGESNEIMLKMRWNYMIALREDPAATLEDLREAVTVNEVLERTARRVLGTAHPLTKGVEDESQNTRAALRTRESS